MARVNSIHFSRVFAGAHRVWNDPGKCRNIHGHNYEVEIRIDSTGELTEQGFVVPFDAVKGIIDRFDHVLILDRADPLVTEIADALPGSVLRSLAYMLIDGPPSTENLASTLAQDIHSVVAHLSDGGETQEVRVEVVLRETAGIEARSEKRTGHPRVGMRA